VYGIDIAKDFDMRYVTVLIALLAGAVTHAQTGPTYRQLAVEHKGQVEAMVGIGCGWVGPPLATIVRFADVAVEGIVLSKRTYPTPDDRNIFTEYEVSTRQIIFQRVVPTTANPGPPASIIFKTEGGSVVFDGYPFTLKGRDNTVLKVGDHVVLFGQYDKTDGTWTYGDREIFQVRENVVLNWLPTFDEWPEGLEPRMPIEVFAQKVRDLAR
jgi:hypothetical protein